MPRIEPFERFFERYDTWFDNNKTVYQIELSAIQSLFPSDVAYSLEVGVGTGRFAVPLNIRFGIDPSVNMLKIAGLRGIFPILGVAEYLPFKENQFDVVLMVTSICFVDDILKSFKEAKRVLKNTKGSIVVAFVDRESPLGKTYLLKKYENPFYRDAIFYSATEVLQYLKEAGFQEFCIKQTLMEGNYEGIKEGYGEGSFIVIRAN
ncbi:Methyltransferase TM1293 [Dissulfuribacter thermophilus]|uniref:Methyltransferase TM1293 n=1 Tax=Dissulfuribacter thermophilus TaxID=1156395 RepID=A0A1B9F5F7_9BACT|nr:class I SAM-dependent methyltransferase [Dissulfuribacter thermophilus]OCC15177.1 Methyltransferase TM1293 [Dissulfuribacter thermophilus]